MTTGSGRQAGEDHCPRAFERELRRGLAVHTPIDTLGDPLGDDGLAGRAARRARSIRHRRQAGAATVAVALLAGGSTALGGVVRAGRPATVEPAAPAPVRHVVASADDDLQAPPCDLANAAFEVRRSSPRAYVLVARALGGPCSVRHYPRLALLDAAGHQVGPAAAQSGLGYAYTVVSQQAPALAAITVDTARIRRSGCTTATSATVRIALPDSGATFTRPLVATTCTALPTLVVDPFIHG